MKYLIFWLLGLIPVYQTAVSGQPSDVAPLGGIIVVILWTLLFAILGVLEFIIQDKERKHRILLISLFSLAVIVLSVFFVAFLFG